MPNQAIMNKIREICLSFPDAVETETWGKPHFRVNNKIFAGCGDENGKFVIGFKPDMDHAKSVVQAPGFWPAPYVGHRGWVSMDVSQLKDWQALREFVEESYRLIAPKRSVAKLDVSSAEATTGRAQPVKKPTKARRHK